MCLWSLRWCSWLFVEIFTYNCVYTIIIHKRYVHIRCSYHQLLVASVPMSPSPHSYASNSVRISYSISIINLDGIWIYDQKAVPKVLAGVTPGTAQAIRIARIESPNYWDDHLYVASVPSIDLSGVGMLVNSCN